MGTFEVELNAFCFMILPWAYGGQEADCVDLDENSPSRLIYMNVYLPVGGTVGKRLGMVFLEEECH